jgi:hypothetical protein
MIELIITISILITYWYYNSKCNKISKYEEQKQREEKAKMEFYSRIHTTIEPHIKSHTSTTKN